MANESRFKGGGYAIFGACLLLILVIGTVHDEYKAGHYTQEYIQRVQRAEAKRAQQEPCFNPHGLGCNVWANPVLTPEQMGIKP